MRKEENKTDKKGKGVGRVLILLLTITVLMFLMRYCENENGVSSRDDQNGGKKELAEMPTEKDSSRLEIIDIEKELRLREDSADWSLAKAEDEIDRYRKYLRSFPEGIFIAEAEDAISRLEKLKVKIDEEKARENERIATEQTKAIEVRDKILAEIETDMVKVAGGTFSMGCPDYYRPPTWEDNKRNEHGADRFGLCALVETPAHDVTLDDFFISKYEVTQAHWEAVMGYNPSKFAGCSNCPVEMVRWNEAQEFIKKLNQLTGSGYRLPTEAEWEYAARGGNRSLQDFRYAGSNDLDSVAWCIDISQRKTHPVGLKKPNELGLFDMTGNVEEYCQDWYSPFYYRKSPILNPKGPSSGVVHVRRGGSFVSGKLGSRITEREMLPKSYREKSSNLGLRLVR